jgi:hypothetical protein
MDACDPGLDISNLKTLIKQNAGIDLKLSKNQICDVYSLVQGGKLPLPPLILSKDGSYLVDAKSPLTRKDFDTLFSSTSKVSEIRRIAKKVGVVRYADKKLTKQQLTDIIGRRLHSMNVHEPVKLRSVQKKQIEKNAFNNNVNLVNNLNVNRVTNNVNNVNNGTRLNNNLNNGNNLNKGNNGTRLNNNLNNGTRLNNNLNNGTRLSNNLNRGNNLSSKIKKNEKPRFLNKQNNRTLTNTKPLIPIREFTPPKQKRPAFLNKSFIKTNKIKPTPGYVFKRNNRGLGMYKNNKPSVTTMGPVQGPARGPIEGPKALENRNREIKENEILLRSYLNRENVGKYINNSEKTNVYNRVKRGTKFNNVKTYINGIVSTKITNEQRVQNQKIKLEQNRNELQKILSELTNLTNTNKNEILGKFNSNGKLNNAKTLAIQKDRDIKKSKLENLKSNLTTFLENKNVNNKGTYINRLNAGEDISNLKREILGVINKKNAERKNYDLKLRELSVLLNSSKNLNNSMKAKFLRNFEKTRNFNKVRKNVEDEFKKINNARNQGEITFRNADQKKLLQKILNNSKNFTNDDKREFMQRLEAGNNFNTLKEEAIQAARNLSKKRKNRELEQKMKAEAEYKNEQRREQRKLMNKIMNNSGLFNNAEKNVFRQRFNSGNNFNTLKTNVINKARQLKEERVRKEKEMLENQEKKRIRNEQQRLLSKILNNSKNMTNENKLPFLQRFNKGENFNVVKGNAIRKAQNLKMNRVQREKNELNRKEKERIRNEQQRLLSKILNNSKNMTNENKLPFLQRFNKGENFNVVKGNAIRKAQNLKRNRLQKEKNEEVNRLAKEEANRLAKEEANRKAKEEANRLAREKANQNAKNEENRLAKEKANQNAKNEANRLAKNEANRLAKEKANQNAKNEANRLAKEKANQNAKNEANRLAKEKANQNAKNEANRLAKEKANQNAKNEANRLALEMEGGGESQRLWKEAQEKKEANRLAKEKANQNAKNEANRLAKEKANQNAKNEANRKAKEEEASIKEKEQKQKLLSKILNNSKNLTNTNKMVFLKRFENGENFNTIKSNAIGKAKELTKQRKAKEEANRKAKEEEASIKEKEQKQKLLSKILNNSKNLTNTNKMVFLKRFEKGENFDTIKSNAIGKAKELTKQRKAKEEANRKAKEEEASRKEKEQKQKLLSKILNNSKNLTNTNKMSFLKRFEKGENFDTIKKNAISKAKELASQRKKKEEEERKAREKEEANRKAKEEMIAKKKEEALAKKKKEDEEKKKKEAENKKKAAQNTQMRASLTKKVKETQMDQKVKNKLLNQLKNYSVQIRNVAPGIEQTIKSEKLNGNYDEAANKKKRQEVKKQLATYISTTYPNMSKADRKKYINSANLTQWRKGILTGSSGMGANQAFERIKGNMERNMKAKKPPPPPINKKANLKKLVNNTMKGRAAKNVSRLKKNINEGISEMAVKTRIAQLNKQTKYQQK